jgi:hypothetical protein
MALAKEKPLYPDPSDIEDDFYAWCFEQAELLRQKRFAEADLPNIIEEIEGLGNEQRRALRSSYRLIIGHLLKWQFQPERRARFWELTIARERINVHDREKDNKSLKNEARTIVDEAYRSAVVLASKETRLPRNTVPFDCPYTVDQLRDHDFMPN